MPPAVQEDELPQLEIGEVINARQGCVYRIVTKIGEGGFGAVYKVQDVNRPTAFYAMKTESVKDRCQVLKMEVRVLKTIARSGPAFNRHFCAIVARGRNDRINFVVMTLVGRSLGELRREMPGARFSKASALRVAIQTLEALEDMHHASYIHRDIKPGNYAIGRRATNEHRKIFILDFGLCRTYRNDNGEIRYPRVNANFRGTVRYAPLNCHNLVELSRKDDLETWIYMMVEVTRGYLPWRHSTDKKEVGEMKRLVREEPHRTEMFENCPKEYSKILSYIDTMKYWHEPQYDYVYQLLRHAMQKLTPPVTDDQPFDWERPSAEDRMDDGDK